MVTWAWDAHCYRDQDGPVVALEMYSEETVYKIYRDVPAAQFTLMCYRNYDPASTPTWMVKGTGLECPHQVTATFPSALVSQAFDRSVSPLQAELLTAMVYDVFEEWRRRHPQAFDAGVDEDWVSLMNWHDRLVKTASRVIRV